MLQPQRRTAGNSGALNLVAIFALALLFTVFALPAYRDYTLREHSKLASIALDDAATRYPAWLKQHPDQRPLGLEDLGFSANGLYVSSDGATTPSANINSVYRISMAPPDAPAGQSCGLETPANPGGFVLYAEPVQTQRIDHQCGRLCLSSAGRKAVSGISGVKPCWGGGR